MFPLQVFQLQLQLVNEFDLFPLMVISVNITLNLNHTVSHLLSVMTSCVANKLLYIKNV